jgi:hypothetical protein
MEQSRSSETKMSSATQKIPHILWNPNVHYHTHNSPPPAPILSKIDPVHPPPPHWFHFSKKHLIISSLLCLGLPSGLLLSGFSTKILYAPLLSLYVLHALSICLLYLITRMIFAEEYRAYSSLLCSLLHSPLPRPSQAHICFSATYSRTPSAYIPPSMWETKFHTHIKKPARL